MPSLFVPRLPGLWKWKLVSVGDATDYSPPAYDDSAWSRSDGPFPGPTGWTITSGDLWLRRDITPGAHYAYRITVDDRADVYWNGHRIARWELGVNEPFSGGTGWVPVPAGVIVPGPQHLALRLADTKDGVVYGEIDVTNAWPADGADPPAYVDEVLADNPLAYWRLDLAGIHDQSGNGHDLEPGYFNSGSITYGAAGAFTGSESVDFASGDPFLTPPTLPAVSGTFTIEAWVRTDQATGDRKICGSRYLNEFGFDLGFNAGSAVHADLGNGSAWLTTAADAPLAYATGTWYHLVFVVNAGTWRTYIDGAQVGTGSYSGTALMTNANHRLMLGVAGNFGGSFAWDGRLDEVAVYDHALSAARVAAHYAAA